MMDREDAMFPHLLLHLICSIPFCHGADLLRDFLRRSTKYLFHPLTSPPAEEGDVQQKRSSCSDDGGGDELCSDHDMRVVVRRLGMVGWGGGGCGGRGEVDELLEEKRASMEELREAFYVFDKNEDGFITPGELWCVIRRLGLPEGLRLGDCERMIRAFDDDGDGRISFDEFARLMENAT